MILRAAGRLFLANGFTGVSMENVLDEVGGSKSTLYRHFADKTELFNAAVEALLDENLAPLRSFTPSDPDIGVTLRELGEHFARVVLNPNAIALHRLTTAEAERMPGLGRAFFEHGPAVGQRVMRTYIQAAHDAGAIHVADATLAASQLYGAMLGDAQMRLLTNSPVPLTADDISKSVETAVQVFLHGVMNK